MLVICPGNLLEIQISEIYYLKIMFILEILRMLIFAKFLERLES